MRWTLFDPYDIENLARLLDHALNDAHFRQHVLTEETQRLQRWTVDQVGAEIVTALQQQPTRPVEHQQRSRCQSHSAPPLRFRIGPYTDMVLEHWPHGDDVIALDDCFTLDERRILVQHRGLQSELGQSVEPFGLTMSITSSSPSGHLSIMRSVSNARQWVTHTCGYTKPLLSVR